jgi:replication factor A1
VFYVSNGQLKPANAKYSSCTFMYEMTLNEKTVVEPCDDAAMAEPVLRYDFLPFDTLGSRVGFKAAVDVLGVVTHVAELGSVARKSDGVSLSRRDITLLDASARTVKLTLWNTLAEVEGAKLAQLSAPILAVKGVRVSDYNGVSLSTVARSVLAIEPGDLPAAAELRAWYAGGGASAPTTEAGAGFASARSGGGAGGAGGAPRSTFDEIQPEALAPADAKPEWATLCGCVVHIMPDATLYYTACPEDGCNKKVVQDGDGWLCEASQKRFPACKRRYILRFKAADATGTGWVNAFDDQARAVFGCSADELHAAKEAGDKSYEQRLREAQWRYWVMKVKTKTEEYNGEARRRITAVSLTKPDYAAQSKAMLAALGAVAAA